MIAVDTSIVIPMFATWHEAHASTITLLAQEPRLPAHVATETFAVLTRLPAPHRVPAGIVAEFLSRLFPPTTRLLPEPQVLKDMPGICSEIGISGGATYDALIALTSRDNDATLVTRDLRAMRSYQAVGVRIQLLSS